MKPEQIQAGAQEPPRLVSKDSLGTGMRSVMYGMVRGEDPIQWLAVATLFKPVPEEGLPEQVQLQLFGALNINDPVEIVTAVEAVRRAANVALAFAGRL